MKLYIAIVSTITLLAVGAVLTIATVTSTPPINSIEPKPQTLSEEKLLGMINLWRGNKAYIEDKNLCEIAEFRAWQIQKNFNHDGVYSELVYGMTNFMRAGENLARDFSTERQTFEAWLASPTHKANLDADFTHSCIRCIEDDCVQIFAGY